MRLSLSVRIAEGFLSKEVAELELQPLVQLAHQAGYEQLCMRASQVGVHSDASEIRHAAKVIAGAGLSVSMVTGDFDTVYNNERGPNALRNLKPYIELAQALGAPLIRVALKQQEDIVAAQDAADQAREAGLSLVHQCHTLSLFETLEQIEETLQAIDRPNFGVIYEPANLELCGQEYGLEALLRLKPWLRNVYLQNQRIRPDGNVTLDTWCRGPVTFDLLPIHQSGGVEFERVFAALHEIDYDGTVTVHQSATDGETPTESATHTANYLRTLINRR